MRRLLAAIVLCAACSRETPAPPPPATTSSAPPPAQVPQVPQVKRPSYEDAVLWFKAAEKFHFVVDEGDVHAEGDLTRPRIGEESVQFRAQGVEWRATADARGVTWQRRDGAWKNAQPPDFGGRVYQRVTVAFDPQKKEGAAQFVADENGAAHFRFTDANSGEVHDVWVRDGRIERMRIGDAFEMKISV